MRDQEGRAQIVVVVSALDLKHRLGCTPAWWQLLKAVSKRGVDLTCIPYLGNAVQSPWWTCEENPFCRRSALVARARAVWRSAMPSSHRPSLEGSRIAQRVTDSLIAAFIRPRWRRTLLRLFDDLPEPVGFLNLGIPPGHLAGIPAEIEDRFGVQSWFYDGDTPASLPEFGGFETGFRIYDRVDLGEYTGVICNSEGSRHLLREFGARRVEVLHWGADPEFFPVVETRRDIDVGFYGIGDRYRRHWIRAMIGGPSRVLAENRFHVWGGGMDRSCIGPATGISELSFSAMPAELARAQIQLNITRRPHASVMGSSSARLFEIAALSGAMVSNPVAGLDRWFEPGREVLVVHDENEATEVYRRLLADESIRSSMGRRAREKLLAEHTYNHRASTLMNYLGIE